MITPASDKIGVWFLTCSITHRGESVGNTETCLFWDSDRLSLTHLMAIWRSPKRSKSRVSGGTHSRKGPRGDISHATRSRVITVPYHLSHPTPKGLTPYITKLIKRSSAAWFVLWHSFDTSCLLTFLHTHGGYNATATKTFFDWFVSIHIIHIWRGGLGIRKM
jgi:hypothetical protein